MVRGGAGTVAASPRGLAAVAHHFLSGPAEADVTGPATAAAERSAARGRVPARAASGEHGSAGGVRLVVWTGGEQDPGLCEALGYQGPSWLDAGPYGPGLLAALRWLGARSRRELPRPGSETLLVVAAATGPAPRRGIYRLARLARICRPQRLVVVLAGSSAGRVQGAAPLAAAAWERIGTAVCGRPVTVIALPDYAPGVRRPGARALLLHHLRPVLAAETVRESGLGVTHDGSPARLAARS
ncbi:MAG: hypothetical protein R6X25_04935 [Candidatus Krumholzibacteriia bacterium]